MKKLVVGVLVVGGCCLFANATTFHVTPNGSGPAEGTSWSAPTSLSAALGAADDGDLILVKQGIYAVTETLSSAKGVTIRGGLAGEGDTPDARVPGVCSTLDGAAAVDTILSLATPEGTQAEVDGFVFTRSNQQAFKAEGKGDLVVSNCRFEDNGCTKKPSAIPGRGAYVAGQSTAGVVFTNCVFAGNICRGVFNPDETGGANHSGEALYVTACRHLTVDDALFVTNGVQPNIYKGGQGWVNSYGAALYVKDTPATILRTQFRANKCTEYQSFRNSIVCLDGNCSPSAFTNCAFVGNGSVPMMADNKMPTAESATVALYLSNAAGTCDFANCTWAYNIIQSATAVDGILVAKGTVNVRNSIFYGNTHRQHAVDWGTCIAAKDANGHVFVDWTMFPDSTETHVTVKDGQNPLGDHNVIGDPGFVTTKAEVAACASSPALYPCILDSVYYPAEKVADVAAFNVHLRSALGYVDERTGLKVTDPDWIYSAAVDAGDSDAPYAGEPADNGGRLNLGAYGNTPYATQSKVAAPQFGDDFTAVTTGDWSQPHFTFTLAGEGNYTAQVVVRVRPAGTQVWTQTGTFAAVGVTGETVDVYPQAYFPDGGDHEYEVALSSGDSAVATRTGTVTLAPGAPASWGVPGLANVLYVRLGGAVGKRDGSSWHDAMTDLEAALEAAVADESKAEVWIAGDLAAAKSFRPISFGRELAVRGGFAGVERAKEERSAGAHSVIDGQSVWELLNVVNTAPLTFERLEFARSWRRGLQKTGAGDLTLDSCRFVDNGKDTTMTDFPGRGLHATGAAETTRLVVTNCVFERNTIRGTYSTDTGGKRHYGEAMYVTSFAQLSIDDTLFASNGIPPSITAQPQGWGGMRGAALYVNNAPTAVRRTKFLANRVAEYTVDNYAIVYLTGSAGPSAFTNCIFAGNEMVKFDSFRNARPAGCVILDYGSAGTRCDFENCTWAYNRITASSGADGVYVIKGTADVRNSIFFGNTRNEHKMDAGTCVRGGSDDAHVFLDWAMLPDEDFTPITTMDGTTPLGANVLYGDPLFVTTMAESSACALGMYNLHLRGALGYTDEQTGELVRDETWALSPAVDAADGSCENEPEPNGGKRNLGAYGNTPYATRSESSEAKVAGDFAVTTDTDYSQPHFTFTLGGSGNYSATVRVLMKRAGEAEWEHVVAFEDAGGNGKALDVYPQRYFSAGGDYEYRIEVLTEGVVTDAREGSVTLNAGAAPWEGKAGPANVVHVRQGATGRRDGTSWTDAYADLNAAFAAALADESKDELWISGDILCTRNADGLSVGRPFAVRGGFSRYETTAAAREPSARSVIDGQRQYLPFTLANTAGVTVDRIGFARSFRYGFTKTGAGDLTLESCDIVDNGFDTSIHMDGRGLNVAGAGAAKVVLRGCTVAGNTAKGVVDDNTYYTDGNSSVFYGMAVKIDSCAAVEISDTLFVSNGVPADRVKFASGWQGTRGAALYLGNSKAVVRNTRFIANRVAEHANGNQTRSGDIVCVDGASGGTAFSNCLFSANSTCYLNTQVPSASNCVVRLSLSQTNDVCSFVNCTWSWNMMSGSACADGVKIVKGAADIRNSIFFGNMRRVHAATCGTCVNADDANGSVTVSYSLFPDDGQEAVTVKDGSNPYGAGNVWGNPLFVTDTNEVAQCTSNPNIYSSYGGYQHFKVEDLGTIVAFNAHLRTRHGYTDETTGEVVRFKRRDCPVNSPAIDAGDPESDFSREAQPNGHRVNLGFYGNTPWSSMSAGGLLILVR